MLDPAEFIAPEVGSEEDSSDVSRQEGYEESAHPEGGSEISLTSLPKGLNTLRKTPWNLFCLRLTAGWMREPSGG